MNKFGMQDTYLVQRLEKPRQPRVVAGKKVYNPFSFGGGYKNGGLSDQAMDMLREIFSFDYMGSAEFEFGAVPKTLNEMAKDHKEFEKYTMTIKSKDVRDPWRAKDKGIVWPKEFKIHIFCRAKHREGVEHFIREDLKDKARLKEVTMLSSALKATEDYNKDRCGWLELDNGFFYFTDEGMCDKVVALLKGVPDEKKAA